VCCTDNEPLAKYNFTPRALDVLDAFAAGLRNKELGKLLGISPLTVYLGEIPLSIAKYGEQTNLVLANLASCA
jgi:FixJ family two-component response regulator